MTSPELIGRRAHRLMLWYPGSWRGRYGEEFAELLIAELSERPRSARRTADIARSGLRARLAVAGLAGHPLDPAAAARAGLATLACSAAAATMFGGVMWSQLAIGMQWAIADNRGITRAMDLMSCALLVFAVLALLAAAPVAWNAVMTCTRGRGRELLWPAALVAAGALVLIVGGRHFENAWPGTGGHLLVRQGLVPGGVAAFGWAATMWITAYWVHPALLGAFSAAQLAWMVLSPAAAGCVITGAAQLLRRIDQSPRVFRYEAWLGRIAGAGMAAFLGGALCWLSSAASGAQPLFYAGAIDKAGLTVLAVAVVTGATAARRAGLAGRALAGAAPGAQAPGGQAPGGQEPGGQAPGVQAPGGEEPGGGGQSRAGAPGR